MATKERLGAAYGFIVGIIRPLLMVFAKRDWRGVENLPPPGTGVVIAPNHLSHTDFATAGHFLIDNGRIPRYLAKESLFRIPLVGRLVRACKQIPVYRGTARASNAYRDAVKAVEAGECVVIYPEGTLTQDPDLWPMQGKTGAARVALATGCPVLPLAQWGPNELLAPYTSRLRPFPRKTMRLTLGPPVDLSDLVTGDAVTTETMRVASDRILDALTATLAGIRGEEPPEERFVPSRGKRPALPGGSAGDPATGEATSPDADRKDGS